VPSPARARGFDALAHDCLAIADDTSHDTKFVGREGEEREVTDQGLEGLLAAARAGKIQGIA
jgi:hypothetical protein